MIGRRKGGRRGVNPEQDPEKVLLEARAALNDLRHVLSEFRTNLDELEIEVKRPVDQEEEV